MRARDWLGIAGSVCAAACSGGGGDTMTGTTHTGGGGGGDTATLTLTLHGVTGKEILENVAVAVAPNPVSRASATTPQLLFFTNRNGPGTDASFPIPVPKGQSVSLFAIEEQNYWGDQTPAPPFFHPTPSDTAVDPAAIEFASWSAGCGQGQALGDCQITNVQGDEQVTAAFQQLKSLNVQVVGFGQFTRTIQTRAPLSIAPVITTNPINNNSQTIPQSIFTDSAAAYAYEVALFSGSQITFVETEPSEKGLAVTFDGWSGGCSSQINATCIVQWPASAGGQFVYGGPPPVPPPLARFQWWKCTDNGVAQVAQGANVTLPGWSCSRQSP